MIELGSRLPTLDAPRVRLRWLTREDAPHLMKVFSDPEVVRYWSRPPMTALAEAEALIDQIHASFDARTGFQWGIVPRGEGEGERDGGRGGEVIGTCTLWHLDRTNRRAEIGYALARSEWGQGLAREAVIAVLDFAFERLQLHRIEADVDPRNTRSLVLLEKLGFLREGYLPERYQVAGEVQDAVLLGLLRPKWRRPAT